MLQAQEQFPLRPQLHIGVLLISKTSLTLRLVGAASQRIHLQESKTARVPHKQPGATCSDGLSSVLTSQVPVMAYARVKEPRRPFPRA